MLLSGENIKKSYDEQVVLDIKFLQINEGDRIGLIGRNGVGKSTLLGILRGSIECEGAKIIREGQIATIKQEGDTEGDTDCKFVDKMQISDSPLKSGGEKARMSIAVAFSQGASILLADEPTNNLDMHGISIFEKMIDKYKGAVVISSQDRLLLDHVCNKIWELDKGKLIVFEGNYTDWYQLRNYEKTSLKLDAEWITETNKNKINEEVAIKISDLDIKYENLEVLNHVNIEVLSGKRTFIVGDNGCGKSSLIQQIRRDVSEIYIANEAKIGYFSQYDLPLDYELSVLENVLNESVFSEALCKNLLRDLFFEEDTMYKKVSYVSVGERIKTAIAKLIVGDYNLLIIDEPTSHMDTYTLERIEKFFRVYEGTLLIVTHDRKFAKDLGDIIYKIENNQVLKINKKNME